MFDEIQISLARQEERRARLRLQQGCAEDLASADRLLARPLAAARRALVECIAGAGTFEDPAARNVVMYRTAQEIISRCIEKVTDTANVRFRARFRMYVETVFESESRLIARTRRAALPWLDLAEISAPVPAGNDSLETVEEWIAELRVRLQAGLEREVETAQLKLVRRVIAGIARSRAAQALRY